MSRLIRIAIERLLKPRGKARFIASLPHKARLLDVGCGNNSPINTLLQRPDLHYAGIDIGDYNQTVGGSIIADEYSITTPNRFAAEIASRADGYDALISSHNLEHCDDRAATFLAMLKAVRVGGKLYLSFPSAGTVRFPRRRGTLNYYDDKTHNDNPPNFAGILAAMKALGYRIEFASPRYRPIWLFIIGLALEPLGYAFRRNMPLGSTWALYGFEAIIWARRGIAPAGVGGKDAIILRLAN